MPIISLVNQKGGVAKSTTAVHLAYWLTVVKKENILLVDADSQRSSSVWVEGLETQIPYKTFQSPDDVLEQLPKFEPDYDWVIVDGPASLSETTRAILFCTDLALVPVQPTGVDLRSASDVMRLVTQARLVRKGRLPLALLFLSRAVKGTKLKDEAIALLEQIPNAYFLETAIHQKQAIADTSGQSATVWELPGRSAAESASEYEALFTEVMYKWF